jgi:hypothetical protein
MTISRDELAAYADGELTGDRAREIEAAIAADPALMRDLERHRSLKAQLCAHFDPIAAEPVPEALAALLGSASEAPPGNVVGFAEARERIAEKRRLPRWSWVAGPALAASLALVVLVPRGGDEREGYADAQLAGLLDQRLVAQQAPGADTRVLLSFRDRAGTYCRAFSGNDGGGIACRDDQGWKLETVGAGSQASESDYRMAGAGDAAILTRAQAMAEGPALDGEQEAEARARGWR